MVQSAAIDDVRLSAGLYDLHSEPSTRSWRRNSQTDGVDILWDFSRTKAGAGMIEARSGQHVIREIVADYLTYLTLGPDNLPESLRLQAAMPSEVIVSPRRMFGQPMFVKSGARMADIANMIKAGEDSETVAAEHGVTVDDVRTATRVLLGHAA